uniref:Uncharacterized protein n=1 Tax=Avena sativa TaxID=4498 RepID=A0ACD6AJQ7_AVESA
MMTRRRSMAEPKTKKITTRSYLTWSSEMDMALLSVLDEHHNNGDHAQNGWKPHVYIEESPEVPTKRQRTGDAILSMIGKMSTSFDDAMKATEPLPMPKVTPPAEILAALEKVDGLE